MKQRFKKIIGSISHTRLAFFILGIGSTVWFLVRVIPKPSRASYPCMKVSAPFMSAFVIYLIGLAATVYVFREKKGRLLLLKAVLGIVFVISLLISFSPSKKETTLPLVNASYFAVNEPIGTAKGTFPGRVVWVHNPDATNEDLTNVEGDFWYMDKNCSQNIVESMLMSGIRRIGGKKNIVEAWDEVFKYYNKEHGKGNIGYTTGERFAIKINLTNSCCSSVGTAAMDASPQMVLAILKQLIKVVKVPQSDIWIGDNYRLFRDDYWYKCHTLFPDVHYVDGTGKDGREQTLPSTEQLLQFSDGKATSFIPQHYVDADYLINMPCLKSHNSGGITLAAKNHQGSVLKEGDAPASQSAQYLHYSLPSENKATGQYRHLVDYMGHEQLGGKTLIYIVDGLWAGRNWNGVLEKWTMAPFNNDYPSSLFLSQDAVAIESVCFDFLLKEYETKPDELKFPYMTGVDDYMKQAADPKQWPAGITYDPEGDGTPIESLGVYEHWNNATAMQYSRNLSTGKGIEMVKYAATGTATDNYQGEATTEVAQTPQDTIKAVEALIPVVIDGSATEECWGKAEWKPINQVWIPYAAKMTAGDFEGKYKVAWDGTYLYLLFEIVDDMLSDDHSNPLQDWYNDDCLEIFLDENRSKGNHERNNNAFAYHISLSYDAIDLNASGAGVNYKNNVIVDMDTIAAHTYLWEVAIKVYDASFTLANPEASRVTLTPKKLMGLTVAYCDNDQTTSRENFIGSMYMTAATANDNYITADYFGSLLLMANQSGTSAMEGKTISKQLVNVYPNPAQNQVWIEKLSNTSGSMSVEIHSMTGALVKSKSIDAMSEVIQIGDLLPGIYMVTIVSDQYMQTERIIKQ